MIEEIATAPTPTQPQSIYIYLHQVPEKDQAVINRVITFAASQGKQYCLEPHNEAAQIVISAGEAGNLSSQAVHIKISDQDTLPYDLLLKRPLLVTRVMRVLDDAANLVLNRKSSCPKPAVPIPTNESLTSVPVVVETTPVIANTAPSTALPVSTSGENTTVRGYIALVVDDSAAIRKQLELELRDARIEADFAETGEEALAKIETKRYDLVFLDIIMPGINGYDVCKNMRKRADMKKTPIIMLSGKTSPLDEVQGVLAGASTYLTKPVKSEQFQQTLKRVSKWLADFAK